MKSGTDPAILVTGGAGYIGAHVCKHLSQSGYMPVTFDNLSSGRINNVKWGPLEQGDLLDARRLHVLFADYAFSGVVHLAGKIDVAESVKNPADYYRNNVTATLTLLNEMRAARVKRLVFSSSCAVYGNPIRTPISETTPTNPLSPYGRSKLNVEHLLSDYGRAYGLEYVACRFFNASGADANALIGEEHEPETHLIPLALEATQHADPRFSIFGRDYATPDGTCIRDFIHVDDLAAGHVQALDYLNGSGSSAEFNFGTGQGHSVLEIVQKISKLTGVDLKIDFKPRREGDPAILVADPGLVRQRLNFAPMNSDIDNIIGTAWNFFRTARQARVIGS